MDRQKLIDAISLNRIEWSAHALRRIMIFVITAYRLDKDHFEADFKTRRK